MIEHSQTTISIQCAKTPKPMFFAKIKIAIDIIYKIKKAENAYRDLYFRDRFLYKSYFMKIFIKIPTETKCSKE